MQSIRISPLAIAFGFALCAYAEQASNAPLHKAVAMLQKLKAGLTIDGQKEEAAFQAVSDWCQKGAKELKYEIRGEKIEDEDLKATMSKADADTATSSSKIEDEAASQSETESELNAAKAIRAKEHSAFAATEAELQDSIDTLERASNVLQRKMRGNALVQTSVNRNDIKALIDTLNEVVNAAALSLHDKSKLVALAQTSEDDESDLGEFGPNGNKPQGSVLDLIEDLKQKAEKQLTELRAEETNARQNFETVQSSLTDEIALEGKNIGQAKDSKSAAQMIKAVAEGDEAVTWKDLQGDQKSISQMDQQCVDKAADYDEAVKNRGEELKAITAALQALSQNGAGGEAASFVEIQSNPDRYEVVNVLRKFAQQKQSAALAQLAGRLSTVLTQADRRHQADPFKKVRGMIEGMVTRIENEAKGDASRKAYCDKETKQSDEKKDDLTYKTDKMTARSDKAKAKAAALNEEVAALEKELSNLATQQADANAIRQDEKSTYLSLKSDLAQGLEGVRAALQVLHTQYGETADAGGGMKLVFSMLEIVEEDTSKSLANAKAEEAASASEYDKFTKDANLAVHTKGESSKYKSKEAKSLAKTLTEYGSDLDGLSNEMDAVTDYAKNIRSECDKQPETYADKKARRETEMEGLQEALAVLDGGSSSLLQLSARHHHHSHHRAHHHLRGGRHHHAHHSHQHHRAKHQRHQQPQHVQHEHHAHAHQGAAQRHHHQ